MEKTLNQLLAFKQWLGGQPNQNSSVIKQLNDEIVTLLDSCRGDEVAIEFIDPHHNIKNCRENRLRPHKRITAGEIHSVTYSAIVLWEDDDMKDYPISNIKTIKIIEKS